MDVVLPATTCCWTRNFPPTMNRESELVPSLHSPQLPTGLRTQCPAVHTVHLRLHHRGEVGGGGVEAAGQVVWREQSGFERAHTTINKHDGRNLQTSGIRCQMFQVLMQNLDSKCVFSRPKHCWENRMEMRTKSVADRQPGYLASKLLFFFSSIKTLSSRL